MHFENSYVSIRIYSFFLHLQAVGFLFQKKKENHFDGSEKF